MSLHPAELYIQGVLSGEIVCSRFVRLAVERHVHDLKTGHERGLWFNRAAAEHAIGYFRFTCHSKGEWAGKVFEPGPWQMFIHWCVFGWYKTDGRRRFREVYEEVARKNGKTTKLAGTALYMLDGDGEPGADIYAAATKRDQAKLMHSEAVKMVKASPLLRRRLKPGVNNIHVLSTNSKFEPLGADGDTMDGLNVQAGFVDELHAHKTREVCDRIETATASRRQPIIWYITTAGSNHLSICWEKRDYIRKILLGFDKDDGFKDDSVFGVIFTLDTKLDWPDLLTKDEAAKEGAEGVLEDQWDDEKVWIKANPNLGVSVDLEDLRRKAKKAAETPTALNAFLNLHLNIWTKAVVRWMPMNSYDLSAGTVDLEELRGRVCYGGLDLAATTDLCALVLAFPFPDGVKVLPYFWMPKDTMIAKEKADKVPYSTWEKRGLIYATPGNVVDYEFITKKLYEVRALFDLKELAYDEWGSAKIINDLNQLGTTLVCFRQGFKSFSPPMKDMMTYVLQRKFHHGGNAILRWNFDNIVAERDAADNVKPNKAKSFMRIDGAVASIMAFDRVMRNDGTAGESVYEQRGFISA